jgi:phosphomethylpyrimidine synthase
MSAIPHDFVRKTAQLSEEVTRPFPNSRKIHVTGSRPDLRVPMREVTLTPTQTNQGSEENPPVLIYDTSGPYTDPTARIDLLAGLPDIRSGWIAERADTEDCSTARPRPLGRRARTILSSRICASSICAPRAAPSPDATSPRCTMRVRGIITPEMEYVAIRENLRLDELRADPRYAKLLRQHPGSPSAPPSPRPSRPSSCATRSRAGAPSSRPTSITPSWSR